MDGDGIVWLTSYRRYAGDVRCQSCAVFAEAQVLTGLSDSGFAGQLAAILPHRTIGEDEVRAWKRGPTPPTGDVLWAAMRLAGVDLLAVLGVTRSRRYDVALDLVKAWSVSRDDVFRKGAFSLYCLVHTLRGHLDNDCRERLHALSDSFQEYGNSDFSLELSSQLEANGMVSDANVLFKQLVSESATLESASDTVLERAGHSDFTVGQYDSAADLLGTLLERRPSDDTLRLKVGNCHMLAGAYQRALDRYIAVQSPRHRGEARAKALAMSFAMKAAGAAVQARRPGDAEAISREISDDSSVAEILDAFRRAAKADAVSPNAWRLYFLAQLGDADCLPYGPAGCLVVAVSAANDVEWWALAACEMWRRHAMQEFVITAECGVELFGTGFVAEISRILGAGSEERIVEVVAKLQHLKSEGKTFECVWVPLTKTSGDGREEVEEGNWITVCVCEDDLDRIQQNPAIGERAPDA